MHVSVWCTAFKSPNLNSPIPSGGHFAKFNAVSCYMVYYLVYFLLQLPQLPPPTNIDESDLEQKAVENDCTLEQFCEGNNLNMDSYSIYVELNESFDCGSKSDVIFMNKVIL